MNLKTTRNAWFFLLLFKLSAIGFQLLAFSSQRLIGYLNIRLFGYSVIWLFSESVAIFFTTKETKFHQKTQSF
jgi:hypothetical protein